MEVPGLQGSDAWLSFLRCVRCVRFPVGKEVPGDAQEAYLDLAQEAPSLSLQDFQRALGVYADLFQDAASNNWSESDMGSYLAEEAAHLPEEAARVVSAFWNREMENIRTAVVQGLRWGRAIGKLGWRVDVQMHARAVSDLNRPCAVVELSTEKKSDQGARESTVFEVDCDTLKEVVRQLDNIEGEISQLVDSKT